MRICPVPSEARQTHLKEIEKKHQPMIQALNNVLGELIYPGSELLCGRLSRNPYRDPSIFITFDPAEKVFSYYKKVLKIDAENPAKSFFEVKDKNNTIRHMIIQPGNNHVKIKFY